MALSRITAISLLLLLLVGASAANAKSDCGAEVMVVSRFKAIDGKVDALEKFIRANFFTLDAEAVKRDLMKGFYLARAETKDAGWDISVIDVYRDKCQKDAAPAAFRTLSASHKTTPIEGKTLRELGRFVSDSTYTLNEAK
jgi:hypothetical protein